MPEVETRITSEAPLQTATAVDMFEVLRQMKEDDLIKQLEAVHPLYVEHINLWRMVGDVALNRIVTAGDKRQYLVKGRSEQSRLFDIRVALSAFLPESPGLLSDFVGAVFSKAARRDFADEADATTQEKLQDFIDSAGPDMQPLPRMAQMAAKQALIFGSVDAMLDHPVADDEDDEGTHIPHMILYTPEQRLDWEVDDQGQYLWVKYRERFTEKPSFGEDRIRVDEYRIITAADGDQPGQIMLFRVVTRKKEKKVETRESIEHAFQSIPIRTLYWQKEEGGVGVSWVKPMVMADVKAFRQESDLGFDVFQHAHPTLKAWLHRDPNDPDAQPVDEINLGGAHAIHLDPGGEERKMEDIDYLRLDASELALQADLVNETRKLSRRIAGNDGETEIAKGSQPESGVALAYRQAQRAKNFIQLAQNLQEWEWQILELVAGEGMQESVEIKGVIEVIYPDKFDQRQAAELEADLETSEKIGSQTLIQEIKKTLAARILGDGATAETLRKIDAEIDSAQDRPPEPKEKTEEEMTVSQFQEALNA